MDETYGKSQSGEWLKYSIPIIVCALLALAAYVGAYFFLPNPDSVDPFASIDHPTTFTRTYYRFFYPVRRLTTSYTKSYSGTVWSVDLANCHFILGTTPTCGLPIRVKPKDEAILRSLKTGDSVRIDVSEQPETDTRAGFYQLLELHR